MTERPRGPCAYCGQHKRLILDHRIPRCRGGTNRRSNLALACPECDRRKGPLTDIEFLALMPDPAHPTDAQGAAVKARHKEIFDMLKESEWLKQF